MFIIGLGIHRYENIFNSTYNKIIIFATQIVVFLSIILVFYHVIQNYEIKFNIRKNTDINISIIVKKRFLIIYDIYIIYISISIASLQLHY